MVGTRQFDEDALLEAALLAFWQNGFEATSMIDVARATGVLRGSLYNAYGDKEQLFLLAFDRYAARFLASAREALSNADPALALDAFFKAAIANMTGGAPSRGCLTTKTAIELPRAGKAIGARVRGLIEALEELVEGVLSTPSARRRLTCDPRAAAELIVTFTRGLAVMERTRDRDHLERIASNFVRTLLRPAHGRRSS